MVFFIGPSKPNANVERLLQRYCDSPVLAEDARKGSGLLDVRSPVLELSEGSRQTTNYHDRLPVGLCSDLGLFRQLQSIIDLDAEVAHRAFQLGVSQQQLYGTKVLRSLVNQRGLGAAQRVGAVIARIQANA